MNCFNLWDFFWTAEVLVGNVCLVKSHIQLDWVIYEEKSCWRYSLQVGGALALHLITIDTPPERSTTLGSWLGETHTQDRN